MVLNNLGDNCILSNQRLESKLKKIVKTVEKLAKLAKNERILENIIPVIVFSFGSGETI